MLMYSLHAPQNTPKWYARGIMSEREREFDSNEACECLLHTQLIRCTYPRGLIIFFVTITKLKCKPRFGVVSAAIGSASYSSHSESLRNDTELIMLIVLQVQWRRTHFVTLTTNKKKHGKKRSLE